MIDSIDKVHQFETELKNGIEKMQDLIDWEEKWDFDELINRINQDCILYINILDDEDFNEWFWFENLKSKTIIGIMILNYLKIVHLVDIGG